MIDGEEIENVFLSFSAETELLRLRLTGLIGQNNMAEHVTSAFGAMVLSGSENWKKFVEFAAQNIFQKEVR